MDIQKIYEKFDKIGCLSFTTVDEYGIPESRIAHLRAYDEDGIYFMTMFTKDFYTHMKQNGKLSICGLNAKTEVEHDANGLPIFEGGYAIRMTGTVKEVAINEIKAKNNSIFDFCIKDQEKYPAMVVFCITSGYGDVFDYDFEKITRENKLEREYFSFGGAKEKHKGLTIEKNKCISCGICSKKCSFLAIEKSLNSYIININRCDECGDCYMSCPVKAIHYRGEKNKV
ncbi:MAG: 4Fe-4S binding protein [Clostridia bacterium]